MVNPPMFHDLITLGQAFEDSVGCGYADPGWLGPPSHGTLLGPQGEPTWQLQPAIEIYQPTSRKPRLGMV